VEDLGMNHRILVEQLIQHESLALKPYKDSVGKLTIGVGRNLDDNGITEVEALFLLDHDIRKAESDVIALVNNYDSLDDLRQRVLIDMAFNLGRTRFSKFRRMLAAVEAGDFTKAADEMTDSRWFHQVGLRASKLTRWMRTGET
jgi:lysozyme